MSVDANRLAQLEAENLRFRIEKAYPAVDVDAVIRTVGTDPQVVEATAKMLAAAQQQQGPASDLRGAPVPASNEATVAPTVEEKELRDGQYQVRWRGGKHGPRTAIEPWRAEQLRQAFFRASWNRHMEHRKTGRGDIGPPPGFVAPGTGPASLPPPGRAL